MMLTPSVLELDWQEVEPRLCRFIKDYMDRSGKKGLVLGLSGGIDSCTLAALCAKAVGGNNVLGLMLPENETYSARDLQDSKLVAGKFKFRTDLCDITDMLETCYKSIPIFDPLDRVSKGNIKARMRMIYVYYFANKLNMLVCGSSDKSETMMGYFTKWGDVAADISPLMDLYKTQVRELALKIGMPERIASKPSSPALWPDQTAEKELGLGYETLDLILFGLEHFMQPTEIAQQMNVARKSVEAVKKRWLNAEHKRRMLLTAKLEYRTVGTDFRLKRI